MTLEEKIELISDLSDNIEDNELRAAIIEDLMELKEWRDNPFKKMSEVCKEKPSCKACDYDEFCCGKSNIPVPEEWKF